MYTEISNKLISIIPEAEHITTTITGGYGTHETGKIDFTTKELDGKFFSVGIVIYSRDPLLFSFTASAQEIKDNLGKFK